jgi:hypothetical protein
MTTEIKLPLGDNVTINDNTNDDDLNNGNNNNSDDNNNNNNDVNNQNNDDNQNNLNQNNDNSDDNNQNNNQNNNNDNNNNNQNNNRNDNDDNTDSSDNVVEVEIDNEVFKLDTDGNAITETGEVKYTADQLKEFEEDSTTSNFDLIDLTQIQPVDTEGKPIQYENTPDGRRKYVEDVYKAGAIDRANKIIEERYNQNPLLKTVSDYIIANGSLEGFSEKQIMRKPISDDSTEEDLIATIRSARKMKGDSEVEIANTVSWAKSDGKLKELAKMSDDYLLQAEKSQREQLAAKAKEVEEQRIASTRKYVSNLTNTIVNGKLTIADKELIIPAILTVKTEQGNKNVPREELIKYATQVNQYRMPNGKIVNATQYQIDKHTKQQTRNINDDIYEMISLFTGQDNNQILKSAVNNHRANTIRKKLKSKANTDTTNYNNNGKVKLKLRYSK